MLELKDSVQNRQLTGFEVERLLRLLFSVFVVAQIADVVVTVFVIVVAEVLSLPIEDARGIGGRASSGCIFDSFASSRTE